MQLRGSKLEMDLSSFLSDSSITQAMNLPALLNSLCLLEQMDLRQQIHQTQCPSLHIFGMNDKLVPYQIANLIQPSLPAGQCEIIRAVVTCLF